MKTFSGLLAGEILVHTQFEDLAVGVWQQLDHFPQQDNQFLFLGQGFSVSARFCLSWRNTSRRRPRLLATSLAELVTILCTQGQALGPSKQT